MIACHVMSGALPIPHPLIDGHFGVDGTASGGFSVDLPADLVAFLPVDGSASTTVTVLQG